MVKRPVSHCQASWVTKLASISRISAEVPASVLFPVCGIKHGLQTSPRPSYPVLDGHHQELTALGLLLRVPVLQSYISQQYLLSLLLNLLVIKLVVLRILIRFEIVQFFAVLELLLFLFQFAPFPRSGKRLSRSWSS
jgi:hypothetical protein